MENFEIQSSTSITSTQSAEHVCTRHADLMRLPFEQDRFYFSSISSRCALWAIGLFWEMCSPFESKVRSEQKKFYALPICQLVCSHRAFRIGAVIRLWFGTKPAQKLAKLTEGPWILERVKGIEPSFRYNPIKSKISHIY
jgi:hypothetical protein